MRIEVTRSTVVGVPVPVAWEVIRDLPRLAAFVPNVSDLQEADGGAYYTAVVADRIGPFTVQAPVRVVLTAVEPPRAISASIKGNDARGQARVTGTLQATVEPAGEGTRLTLNARMEILGKLATLGAGPMRRRAEDVFDTFVSRIRQELTDTAGAKP